MWLTKVTLVTVFFVPPLTTASTLGQRSPAGPPAAAPPPATATATEPAEALLVPPQQQLTAPPQQDAMGLNARSFGAVGDGATDDTAALQAAIDEAQNSRRRLLVPAGRYLIRGTLYVRCYDSWPGACAPHNSSGPLRLTGEGMAYTSFVADNSGPSWPSEAVIKMSAGQGPNRANYTAGDKINHTNFHTLEHFSVAAQDPKTLTRRNYSILAPGLTRCMFSHVQCGGAAVAGMWASGWCNRVEHCRFSGNQVGLIMAEDANSNFVIDSAFEQNVGTALGIMEGEQMTVQGCTIEGNGGPGIVVASARGLLITGNYFGASLLCLGSISCSHSTDYDIPCRSKQSCQADLDPTGCKGQHQQLQHHKRYRLQRRLSTDRGPLHPPMARVRLGSRLSDRQLFRSDYCRCLRGHACSGQRRCVLCQHRARPYRRAARAGYGTDQLWYGPIVLFRPGRHPAPQCWLAAQLRAVELAQAAAASQPTQPKSGQRVDGRLGHASSLVLRRFG
eukprot:COSAG02_NODE_1914_length_10403_cov_50.773777_3_plen_504_part_00